MVLKFSSWSYLRYGKFNPVLYYKKQKKNRNIITNHCEFSNALDTPIPQTAWMTIADHNLRTDAVAESRIECRCLNMVMRKNSLVVYVLSNSLQFYILLVNFKCYRGKKKIIFINKENIKVKKFLRACNLFISWSRLLQNLPFFCFKIKFNAILPTEARSSSQSISFRFYHRNRACAFCPPYLPHTPPISCSLVWTPR